MERPVLKKCINSPWQLEPGIQARTAPMDERGNFRDHCPWGPTGATRNARLWPMPRGEVLVAICMKVETFFETVSITGEKPAEESRPRSAVWFPRSQSNRGRSHKEIHAGGYIHISECEFYSL